VQDVQESFDGDLVLDGNAVAGLLNEIFGVDMTTSPTTCVHCGRYGEVATLLAFTQSPGVILRCPGCEGIVLRIVQTPVETYLDARGTIFLRLTRHSNVPLDGSSHSPTRRAGRR
jgi:hypothetical protein